MKTFPIYAKGLCPEFSDQALRTPINLALEHGDICCFIGPDRRILDEYLRTLAGIHPIHQGELELFHHPIEKIPEQDWQELRIKLAYISREAPLLSVLSGINNTVFPTLYHGRMQRDEAIERAQEILTALGFDGPTEVLPAFLEPVHRIQLAIARAVMLDPEVLLMDDPWHALDPHEYSQLNNFFSEWVKTGAIVMATSNLSFVRKFATKIFFVGTQTTLEFPDWNALCNGSYQRSGQQLYEDSIDEVRRYLNQHSE